MMELIHGVLMEVFGVGVLLIGDSGVGKSEIALDLITRGHLLASDDAVEIKREGNHLVGTSPKITRHFMEIRGIGIIDIRAMYGAGAIKIEQDIDLVINLQPYDNNKDYAKKEFFSLFDVSVPLITIPLRQGRNVAVLVEAAARNLRLNAMGINAFDDLNKRIKNKE